MSIQDSWSCLSVEKFFSFLNWQGQPLENHSCDRSKLSSDLTLQVKHFFQFIPWEGNPEIGSLKVMSTLETNPSIPVENTIADLFEF